MLNNNEVNPEECIAAIRRAYKKVDTARKTEQEAIKEVIDLNLLVSKAVGDLTVLVRNQQQQIDAILKNKA
ncbi:MAG: hypothetical protein ACR2MD_02080 [Aridibacter sp.]